MGETLVAEADVDEDRVASDAGVGVLGLDVLTLLPDDDG